MRLLRTGYLDQNTEQEMPLNALSRYTVPAAGPDRPGLVLEARVLSHLDILVRQGYDSRPASLAELLRVLDQCIEAAEAQEMAWLIGVAATTGWSDEARAYIEGSSPGRSFTHRLVLPYLVDLHEMTLTHSQVDQRLLPLAPLFTPYLPEDLVLGVMEHIRRELLVYSSLSLAEVAAQRKVSMAIVQDAAERLVASGPYRLDELPGVGAVILAGARKD